MKNRSTLLITVSSILLLLLSIFYSGKVIMLAKQNQILEIDLAEVNSIRYGILNADEWEKSVAMIITNKIEEFELTPENQEQLKNQVENILYRLLDEVNKILQNDMGRIKRLLMNTFVDLGDLRDNVPELAESLLEELENPENKENITAYVLQKLNDFVDESFNKDEQHKLKELLVKYNSEDKETASIKLEQQCSQKRSELNIDGLLLIFLLFTVFAINLVFLHQNLKISVLFILLVSLVFLFNGISIPMINIEAKISRLSLQLLGENIVFENQVLFFQSKSILDVVWILVSTRKVDMIFVGVLIFTFSILFPFTKLGCSYLMLYKPEKYQNNRWMNFFTFKSGKWSMADVFVVALFMAFIGFNGIISDQLKHLNRMSDGIEVLTTNGTSLQIGFYFFLLFCLSGLFLSDIIHKRIK